MHAASWFAEVPLLDASVVTCQTLCGGSERLVLSEGSSYPNCPCLETTHGTTLMRSGPSAREQTACCSGPIVRGSLLRSKHGDVRSERKERRAEMRGSETQSRLDPGKTSARKSRHAFICAEIRGGTTAYYCARCTTLFYHSNAAASLICQATALNINISNTTALFLSTSARSHDAWPHSSYPATGRRRGA